MKAADLQKVETTTATAARHLLFKSPSSVFKLEIGGEVLGRSARNLTMI
jgi:hypothetical protein